jgi:hypothetical protein
LHALQSTCSADAAASYYLASLTLPSGASFDPRVMVTIASVLVVVLAIKKVFDTPSRTYDPANPNVGDEYDSWTS